MNTILISTFPESTGSLKRVLKEHDYPVIIEGNSLKSILSLPVETNPELILLCIDKPDIDLIQQLKVIHQQYPLPVVIFTEQEGEQAIEEVIASGVSAYVVNGMTEQRIMLIIKTAVARFQQYQSVRQELTTLKTTLADRKVIAKAKGMVMAQRQCTEDEAYTLLRTNAMNKNMRLVDLAHNVIDAAALMSPMTHEVPSQHTAMK